MRVEVEDEAARAEVTDAVANDVIGVSNTFTLAAERKESGGA